VTGKAKKYSSNRWFGQRASGSRPDTECSEEHQNDGADGEDSV
jgi:hypothetical protein